MGNNSDDVKNKDNVPPTTFGTAITTSKFKVDQMPRWRFVAKAKKTEGYSSAAAGRANILS